jgi:putative PIN family toxin of toxin-antitoxin system
MRVVLDTNVFVSALLNPDRRISLILYSLAEGKYRLLYSRDSLGELVRVVSRPRIMRGLLDDFDIKELIALIKFRGQEILPSVSIKACRDLSDNMFLEIAVEGNADLIVSGDDDLLSLSPFQGIPVITPARFLSILEK